MDQEKIQKLQFLEQNFQAIVMQKQSFQMEISETLSALNEVEKSKDDVYKIIGQVMIKTPKDNVVEELKKKEELLNNQFKSLEEQEEKFKEESKKIRDELIGSVKKE